MHSPENNRIDLPDRPFEVFYDGGCSLCAREIQMIRRMDSDGLILLTDIANANFQPPDGKTLAELMRSIHGRYVDGPWVVGVDVFREIYKRLGFAKSVAASRWPVIRGILRLGYRAFSYVRYKLAVRRMNSAKQNTAGNGATTSCDSPRMKNEITSQPDVVRGVSK